MLYTKEIQDGDVMKSKCFKKEQLIKSKKISVKAKKKYDYTLYFL